MTAILLGQEYTRERKLRGVSIDLLSVLDYTSSIGLNTLLCKNNTWPEFKNSVLSLPLTDKLFFYYSGHKVNNYFEFPHHYVEEKELFALLESRLSPSQSYLDSPSQLYPRGQCVMLIDTCYGLFSLPHHPQIDYVVFVSSTTTTPAISSVWGSLFTRSWLTTLRDISNKEDSLSSSKSSPTITWPEVVSSLEYPAPFSYSFSTPKIWPWLRT